MSPLIAFETCEPARAAAIVLKILYACLRVVWQSVTRFFEASTGNFATLAEMRNASSLVNSFVPKRDRSKRESL
jgi:hypothetical protein